MQAFSPRPCRTLELRHPVSAWSKARHTGRSRCATPKVGLLTRMVPCPILLWVAHQCRFVSFGSLLMQTWKFNGRANPGLTAGRRASHTSPLYTHAAEPRSDTHIFSKSSFLPTRYFILPISDVLYINIRTRKGRPHPEKSGWAVHRWCVIWSIQVLWLLMIEGMDE